MVVSAVVAPVTPCLRSNRCSRRRLCLSFPSSLSDSELLLELDDPPSCIVPRLKFVSIRSKWHPHISGNPSACPVETMLPGNRERPRKVSNSRLRFLSSHLTPLHHHKLTRTILHVSTRDKNEKLFDSIPSMPRLRNLLIHHNT